MILPKSRIGIDPDNDFQMDGITIHGKGDILPKLRKQVKTAMIFTWRLTPTAKEAYIPASYLCAEVGPGGVGAWSFTKLPWLPCKTR